MAVDSITHDDVEMIVEQLRLLMDAVLTVAVCVRLSDPTYQDSNMAASETVVNIWRGLR